MDKINPIPPRSSMILRSDAVGYSPTEADGLFVDPPEGMPGVQGHTLVIGPMGSGKTLMLRTLQYRWREDSEIYPAYIDLTQDIATIVGETATHQSDRITPWAESVRGALSLALTAAMADSVGAFARDSQFPETLNYFRECWNVSDTRELRARIRAAVNDALLKRTALPSLVPSPYAIAGILGREVKQHTGRRLLLLLDQIDQVSSVFFEPIFSLLRRSGNYTAILCMRPCPAAPFAEQIPEDVIQGRGFSVFQLGRGMRDAVPVTFVRNVVEGMPIGKYRDEVRSRADEIATLVWPSLREAVNLALQYQKERIANFSEKEAWYRAMSQLALEYEQALGDQARAYTRRPSRLLHDLRDRALGNVVAPVPLARLQLVLSQTELMDSDEDFLGARLLRILVKTGVFHMAAGSTYQLGHVPYRLEVSPLILLNDSRVDSSCFLPEQRSTDLTLSSIRSWTRGGKSPRRRKQIFVCYAMRDVSGQRDTALSQWIESRFGAAVHIVSGKPVKSPEWSPAIVRMISESDLVVCDLSIPSREVFVEYGIAIGLNKPVIQCLSDSRLGLSFPKWVRNRQWQIFLGSDADQSRLERSIASLLDNEPDQVDTWNRTSEGDNLRLTPDFRHVVYIGGADSRLMSQLSTAATESGAKLASVVVSTSVDDLHRGIRDARHAGTAILKFGGTTADYLTAALGGVFASRRSGVSDRGVASGMKRFQRRIFLLENTRAAEDADSTVPGMLSSHPRSQMYHSVSDTVHALRSQLRSWGRE